MSLTRGPVHEAVLAGPTYLRELKTSPDACKRQYSIVTPRMELTDGWP